MDEQFDEIDLKSKLDFSIVKKILKMMGPLQKYIWIAIISVIGLSFLETKLIEYLSVNGLESFISSDWTNKELFKFIGLMVLLVAIEIVCAKTYFACCYKLEMNLYRLLGLKTFEHLQGLSYSFYDKYSVGWLMARVINDAERVGEIISWGFGDIVWSVFKLIFIFITMLSYSPKLCLIMAVIIPILLVVSIFFRRIIVKYFWKVRRLNSKVTQALNEGISGTKTSKTLVLEEKNFAQFSKTADNYRRAQIKNGVYHSFYYQIIAFIAAIGIASMTYFGGINVYEFTILKTIDSGITPAILFLFISYTTMFFEPVLSIARFANEMKHAQVSASRIFNLLDVQTDIPDTKEVLEKYGTYEDPKKENWEELEGDVEFKHVGFNYSTGSMRKILDDFNLKVKKGSSIALVGETGAGKSTIVNLLCRFYEPTEGVIEIDGRDYKERSVKWLHANLGYVMQTPHLFSGTIKENIRYGNRNASDEEIIAAAKAANADEFIQKLEHGYDTEVGEGGNRLSQGQKQLISFARAIIANPKILVLDEATSSIDTQTEAMIQSAIKNVLKGRTSFIIAHRLSTIVNSDQILVIQRGVITEQGTHDELMKLKGYYYKLYTNQFVEDKMKEIGVGLR